MAELKRGDGTLPLVQLAPEWEETFLTYQAEDGASRRDRHRAAAGGVQPAGQRGGGKDRDSAGEKGVYPALVTSTRRRRFLRTVLSAKGIANPVFSFEEIGTEARPALVGLVPA